MPNPVLPSFMKPTVAAYSHGGPGGVMRTEVAGGAPRYALDFERGLQQFQVTMIMDKTQFSVWTLFYMRIIKKGAITFDMPLDSGFGTQTHACNILPDSYQASRTGGIAMAVSFVVEAESKAYDWTDADAQDLFTLYALYGRDTDNVLARINQFANVDTLVLNTL